MVYCYIEHLYFQVLKYQADVKYGMKSGCVSRAVHHLENSRSERAVATIFYERIQAKVKKIINSDDDKKDSK